MIKQETMPKRCNVFGCKGNYRKPYTKVVAFPTDEVERSRWINAMPNERSSLLQLRQIYACEHHFDCKWIPARGGKRPAEPPSVFPGVSKSCLKQVSSETRKNKGITAEARTERERLRTEALDRIIDF